MDQVPASRKSMMNLSRNTLYEVHWQVLRVSFLGTWTTVEHSKQSITLLQEYVGDGTNLSKVYRTQNLLNAVMRGLAGMDKSEEIQIVKDQVKVFRDEVNITYRALKKQGREFDYVSEDSIRQQWPLIDRRIRVKIRNNLMLRLKAHSQEGLRSELRWFLTIIGSMPV